MGSNEKNIFDLEKVIKKGNKCKGNTAARNMSILSASLPEIMDIIRNATGMNTEKIKNHRRNPVLVGNSAKKRNNGKAKAGIGSLHRVERKSEQNATLGLVTQSGMSQQVTSTNINSPNIIGNGVSYIQVGSENQGNTY